MSISIPVLDAISKVIDKVIPDADKRAEAKIAMATLQQNGEFRELELAMNAIVMEAKSNDKWTSRARPAFLYVMYTFILFSLPMGLYFAFDPVNAKEVADGVKAWLEAIPGELYTLFGAGYLGYVKKRSDDKTLLMGKEPSKILGIF